MVNAQLTPSARPHRFLSIEGVTIDGGTVGSGFIVAIDGVQDVRINSNTIRSMEAAVWVSNYSSGLIENNLVEASGVGIQAASSRPIEIRRNLISAAEALILQDASIVRNNVLRSTNPSDALIRVTGKWNAITNNRVTATGSTCAINSIDFGNLIADNTIDGAHTYSVCIDGFTRAERNRMSGGTVASIRALSRGNWISGNVTLSGSEGVIIEDQFNLIENNLIQVTECGIRFASSGNAYRGNRIIGGAQPVCGEPNHDAGESQFQDRRPGVGRQRIPDLTQMHQRRSNHALCPSSVSTISTFETTETPYGSAGVVINTPGYYLFDRDLQFPDDGSGLGLANGILVLASDVTVDFGENSVTAGQVHPLVSIRIVGSQNVTLRNGFTFGGDAGVVVDGSESEESSLIIESLGVTSRDRALVVRNVDRIDISDSTFESFDHAGAVVGISSGRIVNSRFSASETGMDAPGFQRGSILGSTFCCGPYLGLRVGDENVLRNNNLIVNPEEGALIAGSNNVIENNSLWGIAGGNVLVVHGSGNVIDNNMIIGRNGVTAQQGGNSIKRNMLFVDGNGIYMSGGPDVIRDNLVVPGACGITLGDSASTYSGNVVLGSGEGVCGSGGVDEGHNVFVP